VGTLLKSYLRNADRLLMIVIPGRGQMKRKTAKEILSDSFRELAETKNIDKITVKDITDNCGYSQQRFTAISGISMIS
jgi:hypothetical protein